MNFLLQLLGLAAFFLLAHGQLTLDCPSLPPHDKSCPGQVVTYTCTTPSPDTTWRIYDSNDALVASITYNSSSNIGDTTTLMDLVTNRTNTNVYTLTFTAVKALNDFVTECSNVNNITESVKSCVITVAGAAPPPRQVTWSLTGSNSITISWTFTVNPNLCTNLFQVVAVAANETPGMLPVSMNVTATLGTMYSAPLVGLKQMIRYTITVTATSLYGDAAASQPICTQLTTPPAAMISTQYQPQAETINANWSVTQIETPPATSFTLTHNITNTSNDDEISGGGSGSGDDMDMKISPTETVTFPATVTATQLKGAQYGSIYFIAIRPSNTFGWGPVVTAILTATSIITTSTSSTRITSSATPTDTSDSTGLSDGAVIGIAFGAAIGTLLIIVIIIVLIACAIKRAKKEEYVVVQELKETKKM